MKLNNVNKEKCRSCGHFNNISAKKLFKVRFSFTEMVLAENEYDAEIIILKNAKNIMQSMFELEPPKMSAATGRNQVPKDWKDSTPWGDGSGAITLDYVSEKVKKTK